MAEEQGQGEKDGKAKGQAKIEGIDCTQFGRKATQGSGELERGRWGTGKRCSQRPGANQEGAIFKSLLMLGAQEEQFAGKATEGSRGVWRTEEKESDAIKRPEQIRRVQSSIPPLHSGHKRGNLREKQLKGSRGVQMGDRKATRLKGQKPVEGACDLQSPPRTQGTRGVIWEESNSREQRGKRTTTCALGTREAICEKSKNSGEWRRSGHKKDAR